MLSSFLKDFLKYWKITFYFSSLPFRIILITFVFSSVVLWSTGNNINTPDKQPTESSQITIFGVGDIMLGTSYPQQKYLPPGKDCSPLLKPVRQILKNADITFGNLEGTFMNGGDPEKDCKDPSICYVFRMPDIFSNCLTEAGFNVLSLANNHSGDFGDKGRKNTMRLLDEAGIHHAGLLTNPTKTFTKNNIKYGFCAFAPNSGTCDIRDINKAKEIVSGLNEKCDIVIVSFHGGAEGKDHQHITRNTEFFYGENRGNVYEFAHKVIDAGADVVFGHGPHVTRAIEMYKNRIIAYSLGNFCTYARFNLSGVNGIAPIIKLIVNKDGEFLHGEIISVKQEGEGGPTLDESNAVVKKIIELNQSDFPNSSLLITDDGIISKK